MSRIQPRPTTASVRQAAVCMCAVGQQCSSFAPGHAVHLIQARLVSATPTDWVDAIVTNISPDGTVVAHSVADGEPLTLWNGAGAAGAVRVGEPVAYHRRYHALSAAGALFNTLAV